MSVVINFAVDERFGLVDSRQRGPECGRRIDRTRIASGSIQITGNAYIYIYTGVVILILSTPR